MMDDDVKENFYVVQLIHVNIRLFDGYKIQNKF